MSDAVTAFAPATVSNVACGFDVLGFALERPGDVVTARRIASGVEIDEIVGDDGRLPREAGRNTASVAAGALLARLFPRGAPGVALAIRKGLPLASGLGGSAASAAAAVVAVDALVHGGAPRSMLVECALEGERIGAGAGHPDNVAPAICGGFVLIRQAAPLDLVNLPVPDGLTAVVVHPSLEIETSAARRLVGDSVPLAAAIQQWANLGALVDGLHRGDFDLIGRALVDSVAEPRRAALVPGLAAIKRAACDAGALGAGLSGSGPALFALCRGVETAARVAEAMAAAVRAHIEGPCETFISAIAPAGARVVAP
ncbi:MAG TPA: homoserine kinase [Vicinamibacterales bacterium]|jgi:homoserine kinase|nr:homoserine kinase [Vicinamibacterales bacterium]